MGLLIPRGRQGHRMLPVGDYLSGSVDPSTVSSRTSWIRASYAGNPWVGTSGSENYTEATNFPAVGAAVNGLTPADFDGVNDQLVSATSDINALYGTSGSELIIVSFDALPADNADAFLEGVVLEDANTFLGLYVSTSGVRANAYDTGHRSTTPKVPVSVSTFYALQFRFNGSVLECRKNTGGWSQVNCTGPSTRTAGLFISRSGAGGARLNGQVLEHITFNSYLSTSTMDGLVNYARARYNLPLNS